MKRPTKTDLNARDIYNSHNFCGHGDGKLYVDFRAASRGRGCVCAAWQVHGLKLVTDPSAHWADYGRKTFTVWGKLDKQEKLAEALEWAGKAYGIAKWTKDPFGGWQDAQVWERVMLGSTTSREIS